MSNPLLDPDRFASAAGPPSAWPGGQQPGHPGAPVPPAPDNVAGSPWPPPSPPPAEPTLRRAGVASATAVLLSIVCVAGVVGWQMVTTETFLAGLDATGRPVYETSVNIPPVLFVGMLVGLGLVIACAFRPMWARFLAPLYAVAQGVAVGAISKAYEVRFDGIVLQAVGLTIGVFAVMLVLYATGAIRVTPRFRLGIIAATGAIMLIYLATFVMRLFGGTMPFVHDTGPLGIGFSLVVVTIAALNLTLDFDFIDRAEQAGAPRRMEWFAALGLTVSLIWLYLELLRLLAKLRNN